MFFNKNVDLKDLFIEYKKTPCKKVLQGVFLYSINKSFKSTFLLKKHSIIG